MPTIFLGECTSLIKYFPKIKEITNPMLNIGCKTESSPNLYEITIKNASVINKTNPNVKKNIFPSAESFQKNWPKLVKIAAKRINT